MNKTSPLVTIFSDDLNYIDNISTSLKNETNCSIQIFDGVKSLQSSLKTSYPDCILIDLNFEKSFLALNLINSINSKINTICLCSHSSSVLFDKITDINPLFKLISRTSPQNLFLNQLVKSSIKHNFLENQLAVINNKKPLIEIINLFGDHIRNKNFSQALFSLIENINSHFNLNNIYIAEQDIQNKTLQIIDCALNDKRTIPNLKFSYKENTPILAPNTLITFSNKIKEISNSELSIQNHLLKLSNKSYYLFTQGTEQALTESKNQIKTWIASSKFPLDFKFQQENFSSLIGFDPKTKLPNFTNLEYRLQENLKWHSMYQKSFCLLTIDFKKDLSLKSIEQIFHKNTHPFEIFSLSPSTVAIILPSLNSAKGLKWISSFEKNKFIDNAKIKISCYPQTETSAKKLLLGILKPSIENDFKVTITPSINPNQVIIAG